ncbi:MAG: LacI family DNA-binding transcriptional regulator [Tannerellaceae bacterium]|jgi:LacI family transcriptional regulator|nr:LacI family DNA-binding transcriptional regulator [Tannerellaceae bacterium]
MNKTYRIKDIARLSGVSTGTVDRILHKRGKVSFEAQAKVEKVLREINYQPNLIARSLALKKNYKIITVTPSFAEGEYWAKFSEGIDKTRQELFSYNIMVERFYFNQYDKDSFDALIPQIEESGCQGVVIATLFQESVINLATRLDRLGIPYVLVDAYIENTHCITYYGTHSYDSGYIAGRLVMKQINKEEDDIVVFRFIRKGNQGSTQVAKREEGFRAYLSEQGYQGMIHTVRLYGEKEGDNKERLDAFFNKNQQVKAGIIFNSRACLLGEYFEESGRTGHFKLIGYDVLDANIKYLKSGLITHLIAQRPEVQGVNSLKALFRYLVLDMKDEPVNYMPIDVLIKENITYYNNYI